MSQNTLQAFECKEFPAFNVIFDTFSLQEQKNLLDQIIESVGTRASDAMRVEVPFKDLLEIAKLTQEQWWSASSSTHLAVPLGPRGANDIQDLEIGFKLSHHGLIVGRPGSGKTNLMHVIITTLALKYSPEELELYLIDFKKGVGFRAYADHDLPHARVIAIESEREFGISVLRGLDKELTERGKLFGDAGGMEKISDYRNKMNRKMSRILLIVDEFQEFFTQEDAISREATLLLDRLVRQGRAFGINILLGTQTLSGSYSMSKSTADLMSIRIALQCSDADSRLILGDDNPGAKFLSRPGEAIYNSENGLVQLNKLFQVALFNDDDKEDYLAQLKIYAATKGWERKPLVFSGNLPADLNESEKFAKLVSGEKTAHHKGVKGWLGEPISLDDPTHALLRRQSGANLAVSVREEEQGVGILASACTSLAMQHSQYDAQFIIADYSTVDTDWADWFEAFCKIMPHEAKTIRGRAVPDLVKEVLQEVEARQNRNARSACNLYFVINGLHRARNLRKEEDDYGSDSPPDHILRILRDGPEVGVHFLLWTDTPANLLRTLGRKALAEFGMRAAGVMSNEDSQHFLDDSAASRIDKPYRMLFFDEEKPGSLAKFRPYSIPPLAWLKEISKHLDD